MKMGIDHGKCCNRPFLLHSFFLFSFFLAFVLALHLWCYFIYALSFTCIYTAYRYEGDVVDVKIDKGSTDSLSRYVCSVLFEGSSKPDKFTVPPLVADEDIAVYPPQPQPLLTEEPHVVSCEEVKSFSAEVSTASSEDVAHNVDEVSERSVATTMSDIPHGSVEKLIVNNKKVDLDNKSSSDVKSVCSNSGSDDVGVSPMNKNGVDKSSERKRAMSLTNNDDIIDQDEKIVKEYEGEEKSKDDESYSHSRTSGSFAIPRKENSSRAIPMKIRKGNHDSSSPARSRDQITHRESSRLSSSSSSSGHNNESRDPRETSRSYSHNGSSSSSSSRSSGGNNSSVRRNDSSTQVRYSSSSHTSPSSYHNDRGGGGGGDIARSSSSNGKNSRDRHLENVPSMDSSTEQSPSDSRAQAQHHAKVMLSAFERLKGQFRTKWTPKLNEIEVPLSLSVVSLLSQSLLCVFCLSCCFL
jgi:hypothetical protein